MQFNSQDIQEFPKRYRAQFINTLSGVKTPVLVGTRSKIGQTNLAIFNSLVHIGSHPPLLGLIFRPDSVPRHTLSNILETECYSINYIPASMIENAHQTSAKYPREVSEFDACKIQKLETEFQAPFVAHSPIRIAMKFREKIDLSINDTSLVIGEIVEVFLEKIKPREDGYLPITDANISSIVGLDSYHSPSPLFRLNYSQPDKAPTKLC